MTHNTDAERAAFEKNYRDRNEGSTLYCESEWRGWQAARRASAAPVELPKPAAWMISGSLMTWKGEFAEHDAKAEARRCGGDCTAFALFTEQQVRNLMAAHGIRGSATHTQHEK